MYDSRTESALRASLQEFKLPENARTIDACESIKIESKSHVAEIVNTGKRNRKNNSIVHIAYVYKIGESRDQALTMTHFAIGEDLAEIISDTLVTLMRKTYC